MNLDDVLSDKEPEKPQPVEKVEAPAAESVPSSAAPERAEPGVTSKKRENQEREWDARAAGEGKTRDPVTGQWVKNEEKAAENQEKAEGKTDAKAEPKAEVKAEVKADPPKQDLTERERAFLRAAEEERHKRQELERKYADATKPPAEQPKPFHEDPDGALARQREDSRSDSLRTKMQVADMVGAVMFKDYDAKRDVFLRLCDAHPHLVQAAINAPNPAVFAYSVAKQALDRQEWEQAGGMDGMRAKMEKEVREKIEAEYAAKQKDVKDMIRAEAERLPGSLSNVRSIGGNSGRAVWGGPSSLDEILK